MAQRAQALFPFLFRPQPGAFVEELEMATVEIGTVGGHTVADSTTTRINLGVPNRLCKVASLNISGVTPAASSGGTVTAQLFKYTASQGTPAAVALTAATSIKVDVITGEGAWPWPITASDIVATLYGSTGALPGDTVYLNIVAASALQTQPILTATVEYSIIN